MVVGASDISTDSDCSSVMDPDMALSCHSGLDVTMALDSNAVHPDAWPSDTNMDSGD